MFRKRRVENNLESVFRCIDRGAVSSFSTGNVTWIECCARCHATVHIIIMADGKREKACPRCLVITRGGGGDGRQPQAPRPVVTNRITRYLR